MSHVTTEKLPKTAGDSKTSWTRGLWMRRYLPGLWLVGLLTAASYGLRSFPGLAQLSPMIIGIILGVMMCNLAPTAEIFRPGIAIAGKGLLRAAVALLGVQITIGELIGIGAWGLASAVIALFTTFFFILWVGRLMGVGRSLTVLIAAGTSVCGAAAIAGANSAARGSDEDVTYAVASITLFGTIAMFSLPLIGRLLGMETQAYGTWVGLSVHEVAQVVGAGFQSGEFAGKTAVITKLVRVLLLAVLVSGLVLAFRKRGGAEPEADKTSAGVPLVPGFILCFLGLVLLNSGGLLPEMPREAIIDVTPVLLTAALAALGLGTRFDKLRELGVKPLILCGLGTIVITTLSYILVSM